jgi:hypothetical protein
MSQMLELHQQVRTWAETSLKSYIVPQTDQGATLAYTDLCFAFGLARLGEAGQVPQLIDAARDILQAFEPTEDRGMAARLLLNVFEYRIREALAGKPHTGPLDPSLIDELDRLNAEAGGRANTPPGMADYAVNRLREQSRILEPDERVNPYAQWMRYKDDLRLALAQLARVRDPYIFAQKVRELYQSGVAGKATPESRFMVLYESIPMTARVGESFAVELMGLIPEAIRSCDRTMELARMQAELVRWGLHLAARYGRREVVLSLVEQFVELVPPKQDDQRYWVVNLVLDPCLWALRAFGLFGEIERLACNLQENLLGGQLPSQIRSRYWYREGLPTPLLREYRAKSPNAQDPWAIALQSLIHLAGGWLAVGATERASPTLAEGREELLAPSAACKPAKDYTPLAQAYVAAHAHGPADAGLQRIVELFRDMDPSRVTTSFATAKFYSRFHLNLVEETVFAACRLLGGAEVRPVVV